MCFNQFNACVSKPLSSVALLGLLIFATASVYAQAPGSSRGLASSDGINQIQGRVHFPSGRTIDSSTVKVSLESVSNFGTLTAVTDQDGTFRFRSLQAGTYTVVVDAGKEYEIARETVNIDREASPGGRTIQVAIQLQLKVDASNPAFANVPADSLASYQKGLAAARKGNSKDAVEFLNKAVTTYPNFPVALNDLGLQYMKLGQMDKAGETFAQLLKLKPADAAAHLNLGIVLFNQKKFEDAESHLREALKLNSAGPSAHYYLGLTLVSLKRYSESEKELEAAISNGGDNLALAHKYLGGLYLSSRKNQQAADELEKYLKLDPKAPDAERIKGTIKDLRSKQ
jgi:Flp pilus assembly protein TadD